MLTAFWHPNYQDILFSLNVHVIGILYSNEHSSCFTMRKVMNLKIHFLLKLSILSRCRTSFPLNKAKIVFKHRSLKVFPLSGVQITFAKKCLPTVWRKEIISSINMLFLLFQHIDFNFIAHPKERRHSTNKNAFGWKGASTTKKPGYSLVWFSYSIDFFSYW